MNDVRATGDIKVPGLETIIAIPGVRLRFLDLLRYSEFVSDLLGEYINPAHRGPSTYKDRPFRSLQKFPQDIPDYLLGLEFRLGRELVLSVSYDADPYLLVRIQFPHFS